MKEKTRKTSLTLSCLTLKRIEDYRATIRPIPSLSEAVDVLLNKVLKEPKESKESKREKKVILPEVKQEV
jgi:hypothetical protein